MGLRLSRGPRPRPPGGAERLQARGARHRRAGGARPRRAPGARPAAGHARGPHHPQRGGAAPVLGAGAGRHAVEPDGSGQLKLRLRASPRGSEEVAAGGAEPRPGGASTTPTPNFCTSRMASERSVLPSGSRRKAPSTPVKPLLRVSCAARDTALLAAPRHGDGKTDRIVGEAGNARGRRAVGLGVLLRELVPAAGLGRRVPGADELGLAAGVGIVHAAGAEHLHLVGIDLGLRHAGVR